MNSSKSIIAGVIVLAVIAISVRGCGRYGEVNALTYQHAKALYSACNSRDPERLRTCTSMIAAAESGEGISSTESGYLKAIIDTADAGQWDDAQAMARQLMVDQTDL